MQLDSDHLEKPFETKQEQDLRDLFVAEYMKDFDPYKACIRMGVHAAFAVNLAQQLINEGYVLRQIAWLTRKPTHVDESEDRALLEATLRQAMQNGPYASRVAAGKAFADIKGWSKPDTERGGEEAMIEALRKFAQAAPA